MKNIPFKQNATRLGMNRDFKHIFIKAIPTQVLVFEYKDHLNEYHVNNQKGIGQMKFLNGECSLFYI